MATPALRAIRAGYPGAKVIGVLRPYVAGVLEGTTFLDRQILLDPRGPRDQRSAAVAWGLRREGVDLAVLFPNSFRTALLARIGGCRRRVGYSRYGRSLLLTDRLKPERDRGGRLIPFPAVDSYNRLAERVGCPVTSRRLELGTTPADERAADAVWERQGLVGKPEVICLHPGAAFGAAKHWPVQSFARLAQLLADRRGSGVLVLCGPGEQSLARQIVHLANRTGVRSLADTTPSLGLTKACVRRCDLLVTTDSGPRHFAAAFDRPVVTLFGPTHIAWTETYFAKATHLQKPVPCGPCQLRTCPLDHRCMRDLDPTEVLAAAESLLARFGCGAPRRAG